MGVQTDFQVHVKVLMASYCGSRFIAEQIDSILDQQGVEVTLDIRDDNSSDSTPSICRRYEADDHRVSFRQAKGTPPGAAENFFALIRDFELENPGATFVALSDQDDIWHSSKLERAVKMLTATGSAGYSSNVTALFSDGRRQLVSKAYPQKRFDYLFEGPGPGSTFVLRADLFGVLQQFLIANPELSSRMSIHDWFIYAFARANGYKWYIDSRPSLLYRQHDSNVIGVNSGIYAALNRARCVLLGNGLEQALELRRVLFSDNEEWPYSTDFGIGARLKIALSSTQYRRRMSDSILLSLALLLSLPLRLK